MEERLYKPGELIGHYEVLEHLATGGFCAIYKAQDLTDRDEAGASALKVCRWSPRSMPKALRLEHNRRLRREFELLHRLNHPNIVRALEVRQSESLAYYAMELLRGPTLGAFLSETRRGLWVLMDIYQQVVEATALCHREGIVHRDLTPSNLIITDRKTPASLERAGVIAEEAEQEGYFLSGMPDAPLVSEWGPDMPRTRWQPVLCDLGISQFLGGWPVTGAGRLMGTLEYLSPEYCRAWLADRLATAYAAEPSEDVHTLGVLLYELLTGRLPWTTPGPYHEEARARELLAEIAQALPRDPRELNPVAPPALSALAMRCLQKQGAKRPADAGELLWQVNAAITEDMAEHKECLQALAPEYRAGEETTLAPRTTAAPSPSGSPPAPVPQKQAGRRRARRLRAAYRLARSKLTRARPALPHPAVVLALIALAAFVYRTEREQERARHQVEQAAQAQAQMAQALAEAAHAQVLLATRMGLPPVQASEQVTGTMPPFQFPLTLGSTFIGGLKMPDPDKMDPNWLRPGPDGICRSAKGEQLALQTVLRGVCFMVTARAGDTCPSDSYDPPPEVFKDPKLARFRDRCFDPYKKDKGEGRSVAP